VLSIFSFNTEATDSVYDVLGIIFFHTDSENEHSCLIVFVLS